MFFFVLMQSAFAQEKQPYTPERHKWDISTDLLWLINKNNLPATSILVRKNMEYKNHLNGAIRLRVGLSFNNSEQINNNPSVFPPDSLLARKSKVLSTVFRLGYEWQLQKSRYQFYYGGDIQFNYRHERGTSVSYTSGNVNVYNGGGIAFIGCKYFIDSHVSFSAEASYSVLYTYYDSPISVFNTKTLETQLTPLSVVNLSYHF